MNARKEPRTIWLALLLTGVILTYAHVSARRPIAPPGPAGEQIRRYYYPSGQVMSEVCTQNGTLIWRKYYDENGGLLRLTRETWWFGTEEQVFHPTPSQPPNPRVSDELSDED